MFCFRLCSEGARINTDNIWGLVSVCSGLHLLPGLRRSLQCLHNGDESQIGRERRLFLLLAYLALVCNLDSKKVRELCCKAVEASDIYCCFLRLKHEALVTLCCCRGNDGEQQPLKIRSLLQSDLWRSGYQILSLRMLACYLFYGFISIIRF